MAQQNPYIDEQVDKIFAGLAKVGRPAVFAALDDAPASDAARSKVFGPVFLPSNQPYPTDRVGKRKRFVVQINFAELPTLPGFPTSGILQLFLPDNEEIYAPSEIYGPNWTILFWDDATELTRKHPAPPSTTMNGRSFADATHAYDPDVVAAGRALSFDVKTKSMLPGLKQVVETQFRHTSSGVEQTWVVNPRLLSQDDGADVLLENRDVSSAAQYREYETDRDMLKAVQVGGAARFAQDPANMRSLNPVHLLTLHSIGGLMFGDCGNIQLWLDASELETRNFSNAEINFGGH